MTKEQIVKELLELCLVLDTESTGINPKEAEICEIGVTKYIDETFKVESLLMGTINPIPFAASSKNNISRRMLAGRKVYAESLNEISNLMEVEKYPYFVAHNINYDKTIFQHNTQRAMQDNNVVFAPNAKWICTYRISRQLFVATPEDPELSYSLSHLRYHFDLDVPDDAGVHRAGDDSLVCAKLLERIANYVLDMLPDAATSGAELAEILHGMSSTTIVYDKINFGKHKGRLMKEVALEDPKYLLWCLEKMENLNPESVNYEKDLDLSIRKALDESLPKEETNEKATS